VTIDLWKGAISPRFDMDTYSSHGFLAVTFLRNEVKTLYEKICSFETGGGECTLFREGIPTNSAGGSALYLRG